VVTVTQFHGGEANNVIPDSCVLQGTIRDFDSEVFALISQRMIDITENTCRAFGATGEVTFNVKMFILLSSFFFFFYFIIFINDFSFQSSFFSSFFSVCT
jgi:metal-dependent amidase/aminoacylase/carboxypeptidase family protein